MASEHLEIFFITSGREWIKEDYIYKMEYYFEPLNVPGILDELGLAIYILSIFYIIYYFFKYFCEYT